MRQWHKVNQEGLPASSPSALRKAMRRRRIDNGSRAEDQQEVIEANMQERYNRAGLDREVEFKPTKGFKVYRTGRPL